jgi:hypothetical protein
LKTVSKEKKEAHQLDFFRMNNGKMYLLQPTSRHCNFGKTPEEMKIF